MKVFVAPALILLLAGASVQHAAAQPASSGSTTRGQALSERDRKFLDAVAKDNQAEIQLCRFAEEKAELPAVRGFARLTGQDHERFGSGIAKLMHPTKAAQTKARPAHKRTHARAHGRPHARMHARAQAPATAAPAQTEAPTNAEAPKEQAGETLAKLKHKSGADFDTAFLQAQIDNHGGFIEKLSGEAKATENDSVRRLAKQAADLCEEHLGLAKAVKEKIGKP